MALLHGLAHLQVWGALLSCAPNAFAVLSHSCRLSTKPHHLPRPFILPWGLNRCHLLPSETAEAPRHLFIRGPSAHPKGSLMDPLPLENEVSFYLFEFLIHLLPSYGNHLLHFLKVITLHTVSDYPFCSFSAACKETLCFQSCKKIPGNSLAVQWLGPHAFTAGDRPNPRLENLRDHVPHGAAGKKNSKRQRKISFPHAEGELPYP